MLELNQKSCYAVGIDLGDDFIIRGVLCDLCGNVVEREELEYKNDFESILEVLNKLITTLAGNVPRNKVRGVGIAVSGIVDEKNEVVNSTTFDIEKKRLAKVLSGMCGFEVFLENRPNAAALAETQFGAGRDFRSLVYITSGRGVGAGIVINGKIFRGSFGTAGEIGEMRLPFPNENGDWEHVLLEEVTRASAVCAEVKKLKGKDMSYAQILNAYRDGDTEVSSVMDQNAKYMAYAAQIVANLLNPEAIIMGGRAAELGDKYLNDFRKYFLDGLAKALIGGQTVVRYSEFGRLGVAVGGAVVVLDKVMNLKV
jgi:predicted NBD/HSP70 family sugar kinase